MNETLIIVLLLLCFLSIGQVLQISLLIWREIKPKEEPQEEPALPVEEKNLFLQSNGLYTNSPTILKGDRDEDWEHIRR